MAGTFKHAGHCFAAEISNFGHRYSSVVYTEPSDNLGAHSSTGAESVLLETVLIQSGQRLRDPAAVPVVRHQLRRTQGVDNPL